MKHTIVVKTKAGTMGFSTVELPDDEALPASLTSEDGSLTIERRDWMSQFGGPSIPVYEEVSADA